MTQLYARIKKASKYFSQNPSDGKAFPVSIDAVRDDPWIIKGGIGGQYWLSDVNLFILNSENQLIKIK